MDEGRRMGGGRRGTQMDNLLLHHFPSFQGIQIMHCTVKLSCDSSWTKLADRSRHRYDLDLGGEWRMR